MATTNADNVVRVNGLRDLQRELRNVDDSLPRELRKASLEAATIVADETRDSFSSRRGVAPKVAPSVKAVAEQRRAAVKIGGARYPYWGGAEFGSIQYGQFEPWRGSGPDAGYSLYPSIRAKNEEVVERYGEMVDELMARAFPD